MTEEGKAKPKSLSDLFHGGGVVLFDASGLHEESFKGFIKNNFALIRESKGRLLMTEDEHAKLKEPVRSAVQLVIDRDFMQIKNVSGYEALIKELKESGCHKISIILTDFEQRNALVAIGKAQGLFLHFCSLNDAGEIVPFMGVKTPKFPQSPKVHQHTNAHQSMKSPRPYRFALKTEMEQMAIRPLNAARQLQPGDAIVDSKGQSYQIGGKEMVNNGAVTYSTSREDTWVKLYDIKMLNTFTEAKIQRMLKLPLQHGGLCWPLDVARDTDGVFRGFFMPRAAGEPLHLCVFKRSGVETHFPDWDKRDICELTLTILETIKYLHVNNILLGCINPASIRIVNQKEVYFVDTDNYQVEGFPTLVHNFSFTPPELLDRKVFFASKANENFAVAELVFMLLMPGKTPYAVGSDGDAVAMIKEMQFPFAHGEFHGKNDMPGMWRFMWSHLSPTLKSTFFQTFRKGERFSTPEKRIPVDFWINDVRKYLEELDSPYDVESLKMYPRSFKKSSKDTFYQCNYCGVEHPKFYFRREYFERYRICNGCLDQKSDVSFTCDICGKTYFYTNRLALFHREKMRTDAEWRNQKYCWDCKKKTEKCKICGKETPYFLLRQDRCKECYADAANQIYSEIQCRDCGTWFDFTVAEYERYMEKGWSEPTRCPDCRGGKKRGVHTGWFN